MPQITLAEAEVPLYLEFKRIRLMQNAVKPKDEHGSKILDRRIRITASDGHLPLGTFNVNGSRAIYELANIGQEITQILKSEHYATAAAAASAIQLEPRDEGPDSVIGSPDCSIGSEVPDTRRTRCATIRESIPDFVSDVTSTIAETDVCVQRSDELKDHFPDVTLRTTLKQTDTACDAVPWQMGQPKGVRKATLIIDGDNDERKRFSQKVKEIIPWIKIQTMQQETPKKLSPSSFSSHMERKRSASVRSKGDYSKVTDATALDSDFFIENGTICEKEMTEDIQTITTEGILPVEELRHPPTLVTVSSNFSTQSGVWPKPDHIVEELTVSANLKHVANPMFTQKDYDHYLSAGDIKCRHPTVTLANYYSHLVDLSVIGYLTNDNVLQELVFRRFQDTLCAHTAKSAWPSLSVVMKAFQYLPESSPLLKWISLCWCYLWRTGDDGETFSAFRTHVPGYSVEAMAAFLHSIALQRCLHVFGEDVAVLDAWCEYHNHQNPHDEKECKKHRDRISALDLEDLRGKQENSLLKEAIESVQEHGGTVEFGKKASAPARASTGLRRKADSARAEQPVKRPRGRPRKIV